MVEKDEEISPASLPQKNLFSWSDLCKATYTHVEDGRETIVFEQGGGFRYCRSEEEFTSGSNRYEIEIDFQGADSQVSFGICNEPNLNCDAGVYYFTNAYIYCNYYPSFTRDYTNIHRTTPIKVCDKGRIAVNFDLDTNKISWELNGIPYEELDITTNNKSPFYVVVGMFKGKATII